MSATKPFATEHSVGEGVSAPSRSGHRRRLAVRVALLITICALPLAGLAVYFLSTGLHREIAVAERERIGLAHVRQNVSVLRRAVGLAWHETGDDPQLVHELDAAIAALDQVETALADSLNMVPATFPRDVKAPSTPDARSLWKQVKSASPGTPSRSEALRRLVARLHEQIFQASDRSGLSAGPENEISALTDVVAVCLPVHVERLILMHERMVPDLATDKWNGPTHEAAAIFGRQIEDEDLRRLNRSVTAALQADANSSHVLESFQRHFPKAAEALLAGVRKLAAAVHPIATGEIASGSPVQFDDALHDAFESAMTGWMASINQLDALVADQISEAQRHRNEALLLAGVVSAMLFPLGWLYFRMLVHPVIQAMVNEAVEGRRAAEAARAEADESIRRLRQTQAALDDHSAVTVVDLEQRIVAINDRMCRLSGYSREELLGRPFSAITAKSPAPPSGADMWPAVQRGEVWHGSLAHQTREGRQFWVDATLFPFLDRAGRPAEFVVIETDITELVRARETAESAVRAKSRFLAMMSHEIRTPMNGVIGFAQLLADTRLDDQQRDYARTILTSGEALLVIINDILDFSKLEAGRTELELRPVALRLLVEDVLGLLATQARAKNIELVYWIDRSVPEGVLADGARLRQVLLNLAGNAVKFTPSGHVEVAVTSVPGEGGTPNIAFHVRDTGIGIAPQRMDRLFHAFSQVDASISRTHGGTGLGLAISQRLVQLMGGTIAVSSTPGQGSDFHFTLPLPAADVQEELRTRALAAAGEISQNLRGRRILVVDDLLANRRLLERMLMQCGADVVAVRTAVDAVKAVDEQSFDLAVLDYMMPDANGPVLARRLRDLPHGRKLPMILVTSVQPESADRVHDLFAAVVLKPVRMHAFASTIARALAPERNATAPASATAAPTRAFASAHPLRIVVVDDNAVNLKVIETTLRSFGYAPAVFSDAAAALARLKEQTFDLLLMDVQMPHMDGLEATRQIRSGACGDLNRRIRIIALTAGAMPDERAACLEAGMDDFMAKPVPREELLQKLATAAPAAPTP